MKIAQDLLNRLQQLRLISSAIKTMKQYQKIEKKPSVFFSYLVMSGAFCIFILFLFNFENNFENFLVFALGTILSIALWFMLSLITCEYLGKKLLRKYSKSWQAKENAYNKAVSQITYLLKTDPFFAQEIYTFIEDTIHLTPMTKNIHDEKDTILQLIIDQNATALLEQLALYQSQLEALKAVADNKVINSSHVLEQFKSDNLLYRQNQNIENDEKEINAEELKKYL